MTRPTSLRDDIETARTAGITTIVSLLEPAEAAKFGLADEASACASNSTVFLSHPIRDMHLPAPVAFTAFAADIAARIRNTEHIAIHCYASIGRSGMLTCAILSHFGYGPGAAIAHVSEMRGTPIPDTAQQATFIHQIMDAQS